MAASKFNTVITGGGTTIVGDQTTIHIRQTPRLKGKQTPEVICSKTPVQESATESEQCKATEGPFHLFDHTIKRGYALIINNTAFPKRGAEAIRSGSDQDVRVVREFLDNAGFYPIRVEENLRRDRLVEIFGDLAEKDFRKFDAFVCVILSHGNENGIVCVDEEYIALELIVSQFREEHCPSLKCKPKIFFVQACRGDLLDRSSIQSDSSMSSSPLPRMPKDPDFLVVYSSPPGYQSLRHKKMGSWFIQKLFQVLSEYAHEEHLMDMILRLNYLLSGMESTDGSKQISSQFSTLSKRVKFTVPSPSTGK